MAKTVIVSEPTIVQLVEAYASMAAWYYQMSAVLREVGAGVHPPTDAQRQAYAQQMALHFPEIAHVAKGVTAPRAYVPPPVVEAPAEVKENEGVEVAAPPEDHLDTPAMLPREEPAPAPEPAAPADVAPADVAPADVAPPPMVDPSKVKYEEE